jgi:hypothetical protein
LAGFEHRFIDQVGDVVDVAGFGVDPTSEVLVGLLVGVFATKDQDVGDDFSAGDPFERGGRGAVKTLTPSRFGGEVGVRGAAAVMSSASVLRGGRCPS